MYITYDVFSTVITNFDIDEGLKCISKLWRQTSGPRFGGVGHASAIRFWYLDLVYQISMHDAKLQMDHWG